MIGQHIVDFSQYLTRVLVTPINYTNLVTYSCIVCAWYLSGRSLFFTCNKDGLQVPPSLPVLGDARPPGR